MKKPENTGGIQEQRDENGRFIKGVSGNPAGKPIGVKNFDTLFDKAVKKVAKIKKIAAGDLEVEIIAKAIIEALRGNYAYYRDIMDRRHGKPKEVIEDSARSKMAMLDDWKPTPEERERINRVFQDLDE